MTNGTVALVARFDALPGHEEAAAELVRGYARQVRAEPGCLVFVATTEAEANGRFVVLEQYRDDAAFAAHIDAPGNAAFNSALAEHVTGASRLEMLTPLGD